MKPKPPPPLRRSGGVAVEVGFLIVVGLGMVLLFGAALLAAGQADVTRCQTAVPPGSPIGPILAIAALAGFGAGRLLAEARKWLQQAPPVIESTQVETSAWLQAGLALFLVMTAVLLGYETFALAHFAEAPPITEYVRCAAGYQPWLTGVGTFTLTLLLGNWLWYPSR